MPVPVAPFNFLICLLILAACQPNRTLETTAPPETSPLQWTIDSVQLSRYFPDSLLDRFQGEVAAFARQDSLQPPPAEAALFVGSSSIRQWETLLADMAPVPVINRGFGGSTAPEVLYFFEALVARYRPREIYYYEGDNDLVMAEARMTPANVLETFQVFVNTVREKLPETERIYFISIKPSVARRDHWPVMQQANQLVKDYAETQEDVGYLDVASAMLEQEGGIRKDIFVQDSLHMNATGYELWTSVIRPVLVENYERQ